MHNWADGRKFSNLKYLPPLNLNMKNAGFLTRNSLELFKFNRLPVIKEEEGCGSENEVDFSENLTGSISFDTDTFGSQTLYSDYDSSSSVRSVGKLKESRSLTKLPPLVNINCLMNTEIKQTKPIWETKFGKRLLNGKNNMEESNPPPIKEIRSNSAKSANEKSKDFQPHKTALKRKSVRVRNEKNSGKDKRDHSDTYINRKKSNINKAKQTPSKTGINTEEDSIKNDPVKSEPKTVKFAETPSIEMSRSISSSVSFSKNQHFLTECVQSILDGQTNQITCEHCNESFPDVRELLQHQKDHEKEKETCLLCHDVFFNPNDFVQHLLGHESVDRFSCKKCKKYFPNLRKYKKHCLDYHFKSTTTVNEKTKSDAELEEFLPKFQCKLCKIDFNYEKEYEAHRRDHIRRDLMGAYVLCPKNMSAF